MAKAAQSFTPSVRRVEKLVHETGVGQADRTDVNYELGAEIDGVFVPFVTLPAGRVDDARARSEADKAKAKSSSSSSSSDAAADDAA